MNQATPADRIERVARQLEWMPGTYTIADNNHMRIIELLWQDARSAAGELQVIANDLRGGA